MKLQHAALALALSAVASTAALAQANSFTLNKAGHPIGKASYTVNKAKDGGLTIKSKFEYRLGQPVPSASGDPDKQDSGMITDAQVTGEYKIDKDGNFASGFLQNGANQLITSIAPSKTRDSIEIGGMQGGVNLGSRTVAVPKPDFLVAADYDVAAMQALLLTATNHPHADKTYLLLVPGVGGKSPTQALFVTVADSTPATGKLDGKPVNLKRYALGWNKAKGALYADDQGNLMEAEIGTIKSTYIRNKFTLDEAAQ